ncbi:MAG: phytanoyl-CoA dioxygenase family protein, partial [Acidobacteriota bacterium]|nr:phytanoyl-CoA dioxygenase family protein [Acidobacteriota bacterium]
MADLSLAPLQAVEASTRDHAVLSRQLQAEGYLFVRGLIDPEKVGRVRSDIGQLLIRRGFAVDDPQRELKWSGRMPESTELTPSGPVGRMIGDLPSLTEVIHDRELFSFLGALFDGEVFSWVENADRVRIIFQDLAPGKTRGQHFDYVTPAHQDGYHFRVSFVTCWVALMDIDLTTGGLALCKGSHRKGVHQHWYRGAQYLGIPQNPEQAREMARMGAVPVAGESAPDDSPKTWLRSDYRAGDVLIFHPHMV